MQYSDYLYFSRYDKHSTWDVFRFYTKVEQSDFGGVLQTNSQILKDNHVTLTHTQSNMI